MKKASYLYGIIVGICMITMWTLLLITKQVPEIHTEPIRISTHIASEFITAILLLLGGITSIQKVTWGPRVHTFSLGMLLYSVLNAGGYYLQLGEYAMAVMFTCLFATTLVFLIKLIKLEP